MTETIQPSHHAVQAVLAKRKAEQAAATQKKSKEEKNLRVAYLLNQQKVIAAELAVLCPEAKK